MRKVLIIAYPFSRNVIGAVRLRGLAKYLSELSWEPTILTVKSSQNLKFPYRIIEAEADGLLIQWKKKIDKLSGSENNSNINVQQTKSRKSNFDFLLKMGGQFFAYPDLQKYWYEPAVDQGSKLLEKEDFDAIISSSSPVTSHLVANELKKRFKIPWIADFRDLWTQNPYYHYNFLRKFFEQRLEIKTLKNADILTTTTTCFADELKSLHGREDVFPILNGFDPDQTIKNTILSDKLNLTYSGLLYRGKRDPKLLFKALKELDSEKSIELSKFSIDFYSPVENWLMNEVEEYHLENVVNVHGMIPREEVLKKQRESQILLLLSWNNPQEQGIIPGKIYEYLDAGRPILSIGPSEGLVKDLIQSTNTGIHLSGYESVKKVLKMFYDEFEERGKIEYGGIPEEIDKYSQREMAKKFTILLDKIVE